MRHKVSPGCGAFAEESEDEEAKERKASDPCDRKPCRHGECSAKSTHPGFHCECQPGFAGKLCDIRGGYDQRQENCSATLLGKVHIFGYLFACKELITVKISRVRLLRATW